jgi:hypothetical protein
VARRTEGTEAWAAPVVVEGVDVRKVVRAWVEEFVRYAPHAEDVVLVEGYLVRCVETDVGAECAVGVMQWWAGLNHLRNTNFTALNKIHKHVSTLIRSLMTLDSLIMVTGGGMP